MAVPRSGIENRRKGRIANRRGDGETSWRTLRPLALMFRGRCWTLGAWRELRGGFRTFRVDRITDAALLCEEFDDRHGHLWGKYLRIVRNGGREDGAVPPGYRVVACKFRALFATMSVDPTLPREEHEAENGGRPPDRKPAVAV